MLVYRFENEAGIGPYRGQCSSGFRKYIYNNFLSCPRMNYYTDSFKSWYSDVKYDVSDLYFGTSSLEKLYHWFHIDEESLKYFNDNGFFVSVYDTENFIEDENQVCFKRSEAKKVEECLVS